MKTATSSNLQQQNNTLLSTDQAKAFKECTQFTNQEHALTGFAGTGKTYLLKAIIEWYENKGVTVHACASTHKATSVLAEKLDCEVATYHSACGLRVTFNARNGEMKLSLKGKSKIAYGSLWVIDEASMINYEELKYIRKEATKKHVKVLFAGDPFQLSPVKGSGSPALTQPNSKSTLTQLHRQDDDNPLLKSISGYRQVLQGSPFPAVSELYKNDCGVEVLDRDAWEKKRLTYYSAANPYDHIKSLYFTNDAVINANNILHTHCTGRDTPQIGDRLIINTALEKNQRLVFNTDEVVTVEDVQPATIHDLDGHDCLLIGRNDAEVFLPANWSEAKTLLSGVKKEANRLTRLCKEDESYDIQRRAAWREYYALKNTLVDARRPYACTVHKSQGSTYNYAFVDLDDIGKCTVPDTIARLLYVAFSRPRKAIFVTGTLPQRLDSHNREALNDA